MRRAPLLPLVAVLVAVAVPGAARAEPRVAPVAPQHAPLATPAPRAPVTTHAAQSSAIPAVLHVGAATPASAPAAHAAPAVHAPQPRADAIPAKIVVGSRTTTVAGREIHTGVQPPTTGAWVNRAGLEMRVESQAKFIEQQKTHLVGLERDLDDAKSRASRVSAGAADTRARVTQSPYAQRGGSLHLDRMKELAYHATGQDEHAANERVRGLEKAVTELRGRIETGTKTLETNRAELAAHPEARWFKD